METNNNNIVFPIISPDFPRKIYDAIYDLTGRKNSSQNLALFRSEFTSLHVWHALRCVYIYFKTFYPNFKYIYDFKEYDKYQPLEIVEHLRGMLAKTDIQTDGQYAKLLNWEHIGECDTHFEFFVQLVDSFLEAVQGLSFSAKFDQRMEKFLEKIRSFSVIQQQIINDYLQKNNYKPITYAFSKEHSKIIYFHSTEWGEEKTSEFLVNYIVPLLIENNDLQLSTEKLLALITRFENSYTN